MIKNYLKIAVRNLTRNKIFAFINIAGLSLGLTCCMLIVLYTKDEVSFDRFQENKDQLFRIKVTMSDSRETRTIGSTNTIHGPSFKEEIPEINEIVRVQSNTFVTRKRNELLSEEIIFADNNFFTVFSMPLIAGDPKTVLSNVNSIVLTEEIAEKYFNTKDAVGKTMELKIGDNFEKLIVSGIAKKCPQNSSVQFGAVIPFELQVTRGWTDKEWLGFYMNTFVLLHEKADYRTVIPKLNQVFKTKSAEEISNIKDFDQRISFSLQPFLDIHLDSEISVLRNGLGRGSSPIYSYILSGIAIFILLIACINFVNLTVARSLNRAKEIGIRKVVGSQRKQLMYQFLGESFLLSFIAFSFAIVLTLTVLPTFNELANKQLALSYLFDIELVSGYFALFLITGMVAGFYPALVLSGLSPAQTLYNRTKLTQKNYLTKGLVVFQFALSVCLVIGTIVIYSQFKYLTNKNLGYSDKNLMSFSLGRGQSGEKDAKNLKRYESEAKWKEMITLAAMLSIFVSCIGLFGLATFNAETRVKEIGIRKVLGASAASIAALLSSDFIKLVLAAIVVALPFSYYAVDTWLQDFPYRIAISWWFFAVAALLAIMVAILTVGYQSLKTALMDPATSLRSE